MRNIHLTLLALVLLTAASVHADYAGYMKKGNDAYNQGKFDAAAEQYRLAETERPAAPEVSYNLGNALYGKKDYDGAIQAFQHVVDGADPELQQRGYYNLGSSQFKKENWMEAIKAFEEAVKRDPNDVDAKFNLELSRKMLKEHSQAKSKPQDQKQNQQQQQQQNQQQQDQQKQDSTKQDQSQKNDEKNQQQQQQQQQDQQKQEEQQAANKVEAGKKMSKEDAERILNSLKQSEKAAQGKLRRVRGQAGAHGKDW